MLGIASTAILLDMACPVDSQFLRVAGRAWLAKQPITNRKAKKMIYTTENSTYQVSVNPRPQGLEVQVSFWDGEDFQVKYEQFVIAESWYEAITDALVQSGFDWDTADYQVNKWGITPPNDEE